MGAADGDRICGAHMQGLCYQFETVRITNESSKFKGSIQHYVVNHQNQVQSIGVPSFCGYR